MSSRSYSTRDECVDREVVAPIEAAGSPVRDARAEYDIEAIAEEVVAEEHAPTGPVFYVSDDAEFWEVVERHAR